MPKKRKPILSETICTEMEDLRRALEVHSGKDVHFFHIDFNTGRARVSLGIRVNDLLFSVSGEQQVNFSIDGDSFRSRPWSPGLIQIIQVRTLEYSPHPDYHPDGRAVRIMGRSRSYRWKERLGV